MAVKVEITRRSDMTGIEKIDYAIVVSRKRKIDNTVHSSIPQGLTIDSRQSQIQVDNLEILKNYTAGGNDGYFGSIYGDGSPKRTVDLYLGGYIEFTTPELVKIRVSHISEKEAISLGQRREE
jgi:hypothetical protein